MSALAMKHFDTLDFVKKSKEYGASEQLAEYQARQIEHAIDIAVTAAKDEIHAKDLATKKDVELMKKDMQYIKSELEIRIEQSKNQIIIWVAGLFVASGLIQHFFK